MSDNNNNNNYKGVPINESVGDNDGNRLIHSLQTDSSNYAPPPVTNLSGNTSNTANNNNKNK